MSGSDSSNNPSLLVTELSTLRTHRIEVHPGDCIDATALIQVKGPSGGSIRVLDEGSRNTICIKSAVSHLDAETGRLYYRQIPIEALFTKHDFAGLVHLLVLGSLPTPQQSRRLDIALALSMRDNWGVQRHIQCFSKTDPFMTMIFGGISACVAIKPEFIPVHEDQDVYGGSPNVDSHIIRTLAALAFVICVAYCHRNSLPLREPREDLSLIGNMLYMMHFANDEVQRNRVDSLVFLHAEHGACNATTAFLHTASTRADPLSCLLSGLASIYGPMHGGSNIVTYHQLQKIERVENIPTIVAEVKGRKRRLYGFGHRIYRAIDPRATLLRAFLDDCSVKGVKLNPLYDVAKRLEETVNTDPFFVSRHIKANTDLYTVLAYDACGIPEDLVFPFICLSRAVGFLAHWRELIAQSPTPWRPQELYIGPPLQPQSKL